MTARASWREAAACQDADPDLFFPVGTAGPASRQIEEAKRICRSCPAQAPCLAWALDHGVGSGVWGGATEGERRALRRRPAARKRPAANDGSAATGYPERIGTKPNSRPAELIWIQATAAGIRIACEKMTAPALGMLRTSVECAASLPTRPGWERKAVAHAEIFRLLAEIAGDRAAGNPGGGAGCASDLMRAVGPAANGMITGSRRRLLEHLLAGDADAAEREMETHLRALHFMWRLARAPAQRDKPRVRVERRS